MLGAGRQDHPGCGECREYRHYEEDAGDDVTAELPTADLLPRYS